MKVVFDSKDPGERITLKFDFTADLATETISGNPEITSVVIEGTDPNASAMVAGAPFVDGKVIYQDVAGGIHGNDYLVRCFINTNGNHTYARGGILPVRNAGQ